MRLLTRAAYAVIFALSCAAGLIIWAPWEAGAIYAVEKARIEAARMGYYVTFDRLESSGVVRPELRFVSLDIEGPMTKMTFAELSLKPRPVASLISGSARMSMEFGPVLVAFIPNNSLTLSGGRMNMSLSPDSASISEANVEGEMSMTGDIAFDFKNRAILSSTAVMKAPPYINMLLGTPVLRGLVEPVSQGEWRIKSNAPQNR
jgi:hypothetical protein